MSVNFSGPVNEKTKEELRKIFGVAKAEDGQTFLYDQLREIEQTKMKKVVQEAGQTATVELNEIGEIKTMSDGRRYEVTPQGWKRLPTDD